MLYILALTAFFSVHIIPLSKKLKTSATAKLGEKLYRGIFALIALASIALVVWGWRDFPNTYFYEPSVILKKVNFAIMFIAVYLWVAAEIPNNLRRLVRHPMLLGMKLWALGHLLANGDLRSMILFLAFLIYSIIAVVVANRRGTSKEHKAVPIIYDVGVLIVSLVGYSAIMHFHGNLFGMPVVQYFSWS